MKLIKSILCRVGIHKYAHWWLPEPTESVRPNPHCKWCGTNLKEPKRNKR